MQRRRWIQVDRLGQVPDMRSTGLHSVQEQLSFHAAQYRFAEVFLLRQAGTGKPPRKHQGPPEGGPQMCAIGASNLG
jgi:hypothetical protein